MTYLSIKNWRRFQHYKDRRPPWIKLYEELLDDDELSSLPPLAQLVYFKLLLVASRRDNAIPVNLAWLSEEIQIPRRTVSSALDELVASGFASTSASKPASTLSSNGASPSRASPRSQEAEAEAETETPKPPSRQKGFHCATCGIVHKTQAKLEAHLTNVHGLGTPTPAPPPNDLHADQPADTDDDDIPF